MIGASEKKKPFIVSSNIIPRCLFKKS